MVRSRRSCSRAPKRIRPCGARPGGSSGSSGSGGLRIAKGLRRGLSTGKTTTEFAGALLGRMRGRLRPFSACGVVAALASSKASGVVPSVVQILKSVSKLGNDWPRSRRAYASMEMSRRSASCPCVSCWSKRRVRSALASRSAVSRAAAASLGRGGMAMLGHAGPRDVSILIRSWQRLE